MKKIIYQFLGFFAIAALPACEDAVYKTDLSKVTDDVVWEDPKFIKATFDNVMHFAIPGREWLLLGHSDESKNSTRVLYDNYVANDLDDEGYSDNVDRWPYETLRKINRFLDHAGYDGFASAQPMTSKLAVNEKEDMIGQLLVVRAYHYFDLVRTYGGVPLLLHEQEATSNIEDLQTPRAKTSECVEQIIKDLNAAIALPDASFPMKRNDGHIGKGVAYALKGKVLLYYASPQFTRQTPAGTKPAEQRWNEAYTACKVAYDSLKTAGFGLYAEEGGDRAKVMENYYKMLVTEEMNKEMIWVRRYEPLINNNQIDQRFRPSSSGGSSVNVTLEFVNAFANNDGTPFTGFPIDYSKDGSKVLGDITQGAIVAGGSPTGPDGDAVNRTAFWVDREPRFYAFINYNGCEFPLIRRNSSALSGDVDATGKMKHGWIFCWGANGNLDPFDNGFENTNNRGQGFTIRKFISDDRDYSATGTSPLKECGTDWPLFRFAEVMLNYAEAAAKTGHPDEAYAVLDALRKRAGILPGNNYGLGRKTGDALMLDILNERRIELAFESQRYYDLRRWDLFAGGLSGYKLNGLQRHAVQTWVKDGNEKAANVNEMVSRVNGILTAGGIDTPAGRDAYFDVFYHTVMLYDTEPVHYNPDRQDFLRIPYTAHIQKNPLIEQTIGWTDDRSAGTFNPYE